MPERVTNTRWARLISIGKHRINSVDELIVLISVLSPDSKNRLGVYRSRLENNDGKFYLENWIENEDIPEYRRMRRDLLWEKELDGEIGKVAELIT